MDNELSALITDDETHMRTFLKFILMKIGITKIYMVENGRDAIDAFREYAPDLVLMDINMNKMNGIEALQGIMAINPNAVVVMMTAVSTQKSILKSESEGAVYYILKTQSPEQITANLEEVVEQLRIAR